MVVQKPPERQKKVVESKKGSTYNTKTHHCSPTDLDQITDTTGYLINIAVCLKTDRAKGFVT